METMLLKEFCKKSPCNSVMYYREQWKILEF